MPPTSRSPWEDSPAARGIEPRPDTQQRRERKAGPPRERGAGSGPPAVPQLGSPRPRGRSREGPAQSSESVRSGCTVCSAPNPERLKRPSAFILSRFRGAGVQTGAAGTAPGHRGLAGRLPGWKQGRVKLVTSHVCRLRPVVAGASRNCRLEPHVAPRRGSGFPRTSSEGEQGAAKLPLPPQAGVSQGLTSAMCPTGLPGFLPGEGTRPLSSRHRVDLPSRGEQAAWGTHRLPAGP